MLCADRMVRRRQRVVMDGKLSLGRIRTNDSLVNSIGCEISSIPFRLMDKKGFIRKVSAELHTGEAEGGLVEAV